MSSRNMILLRINQKMISNSLSGALGHLWLMLFVTGTGKICIKETELPNKKIVIA